MPELLPYIHYKIIHPSNSPTSIYFVVPNPTLQTKPVIHSNSDSLLLHKSTFPTVTHTTHRSLPSKLHLPLHLPLSQSNITFKPHP